MVWPETALPFFFQDKQVNSARVESIAEDIDADLLFGSPAYERSGNHIKYYNRAYLLAERDQSLSSYDKVHLVPFGEYVPLKRVLFFIGRLVPAAGDFEPGNRIAPLKSEDYSAGVLICFEAIFPGLTRTQSLQGADIIVNLTNDAWFGRTSAPHQHLAMSVFRAVESRLPLVRAANTGISAFIDPKGRIKHRSELFEEAALIGDVYPNSGPATFYTLHGDLFSFFLLFMVFVKLLRFQIQR
jgi:apolipoprotein N-acyltransferase